ncbi:MAG: hypothetical protein RIQ52_663 [Pseudomonadota bacterium]|jgi:cytochrome c peroxidase
MFTLRTLVKSLLLSGISATAMAANWQALPTVAPAPADNPTTDAKVTLGKQLYHDPRLSSSGTVSCNSCHNSMLGGEDNRGGSVGVKAQVGGRSAPTVWNAAFSSVQFWDGRAASLEAQAKGPVTNPIEMGMKSWDDVVVRLKAIPGYVEGFKTAFGDGDTVTADNAAKAIAAYERTLITPNSAYDKYVNGNTSALTEQQVRGMNLFAETGCSSCHSGPAFNGPTLPEGQGFYMKFPVYENAYLDGQYHFSKDKGRADHTKNDADLHLFKVPTLRNIAITAPYFHNGKVTTLDAAVNIMAKTQLNKDLSDAQVADIVAFLNSLTGEFPQQSLPHLPPLPNTTFDFE